MFGLESGNVTGDLYSWFKLGFPNLVNLFKEVAIFFEKVDKKGSF